VDLYVVGAGGPLLSMRGAAVGEGVREEGRVRVVGQGRLFYTQKQEENNEMRVIIVRARTYVCILCMCSF
jgi:hypothetical protein